MRVLVVNTGSSSLKLSVVEADGPRTASTTIERWEGEQHLDPLADFLAGAPGVGAVGHRVVHGGPRLTQATRLDPEVVDYLESLNDLAPLHNPRAVAAIRAVGTLLADLPEVAAFDTSFHARMPPAATTYALPREWNRDHGLRRYGFHGLSHQHAVRRGAELLGRPLEDLRVVSCHLGAGCSLAAVLGGRSVDTTMGFTPLEGLVMQTRAGSVDPGLLLWLLEHTDLEAEELRDALEHRSGLRGLSGTSGDLRDVLAARADGDTDAALAFDVFVHRLVQEVATMAASTGGLDLLVFTGGMGENSPALREAAARGLRFLDVALDPAANDATADALVSPAGSAVGTAVVTAAEDLEVARQTRQVLAG